MVPPALKIKVVMSKVVFSGLLILDPESKGLPKSLFRPSEPCLAPVRNPCLLRMKEGKLPLGPKA